MADFCGFAGVLCLWGYNFVPKQTCGNVILYVFCLVIWCSKLFIKNCVIVFLLKFNFCL